MLRLNFLPVGSGLAVQTRAAYFRFCADGTVRGSDNSVAAIRLNDHWQVAQRLFRECQCTGPVWLRIRSDATAEPVNLGPYSLVRTIGGRLYTSDPETTLDVPGWNSGAQDREREVSVLPAAQWPPPDQNVASTR